MKCDICKSREATLHIQEVSNNNIKAIHLCEECAKAYGIKSSLMDLGFTLIDLLSNINAGKVKAYSVSGPADLLEVDEFLRLRCPVCGETFMEFKQTGKFGCGTCYITFKDKIKPILRKIHGKALHKGKVPKKIKNVIKLNQDLREMKNRLKVALKTENYEEAAKIRDELKKLKKKIGEEL